MKRKATKMYGFHGPVAKRLRTVERQVYLNRNEMRTKTVDGYGILSGVVDPNNPSDETTRIKVFRPCRIQCNNTLASRQSNTIRVFRIEVRGVCNVNLDSYIIQKKTTSDPTVETFSGSSRGAFIGDNLNKSQFTEWKHYRNPAAQSHSDACKFSHSWKGGILVKFNGPNSTDIIDNELTLVLLNRFAEDVDYNLSCRIWYTDA